VKKQIIDYLLSLEKIDPTHVVLAFLSILPWAFFLLLLHPASFRKKFILASIGLFFGFLTTRVILGLHPLLWPEIDFKPKRMSLLSQTAHIAFIQAGMMEETFKILFILILGYWFCFDWANGKWKKDIVIAGGFVALGFSFIENYVYIHKESRNVFEMFIGRTIVSSNIHLLINLCFSLFLLKLNLLKSSRDKVNILFFSFRMATIQREKIIVFLYAYILAIIQHGVVDFFLIPSSRFGNWLAIALFVGIWVWVVKDMRELVYNEIDSPMKVEEEKINLLTDDRIAEFESFN
jgi:RsiW-degrading membrane proteinase PrsW (M82 family)